MARQSPPSPFGLRRGKRGEKNETGRGTKKQIAERLAKATMGVLMGIKPTKDFLKEMYLRELTKIEAEAGKSETEKTEPETGMGSQGLFDY